MQLLKKKKIKLLNYCKKKPHKHHNNLQFYISATDGDTEAKTL